MSIWSEQIEEEITFLLKEWLKQQGRTQADLKRSLQAQSTRMPALLEALQKEYRLGGLPKLAAMLCQIEDEWAENQDLPPAADQSADPFGQLDLLLQEIRDDCDQ